MRDLMPTVADLNRGEDEAYDDARDALDVDSLQDELDLINYTEARDAGDPQRAIDAYFGAVRASELELGYQHVLAVRRRQAFSDELRQKYDREAA